MEKLMYLAWLKPAQTAEQFRHSFINVTARQLHEAGAQKLRLTVDDSDVSPAAKHRLTSAQLQTLGPPMAVMSLWLDSATAHKDIEKILLETCRLLNGYVVSESEPLPNTKYPARNGKRTEGMNQVVFLQKPARLSREQWLDIWLNSHTAIAIKTQSTFGYRQNVVTRTLADNALPIDAIVEENFPAAAMTSPHAFYNAAGDDTLLRQNQSRMFGSVQRFIDLDKIDCLPMSEYNF